MVHRWGPKDKDRVYIQAALHADELPGILVANKLIELLDSIDVKGAIKKEIVLINLKRNVSADGVHGPRSKFSQNGSLSPSFADSQKNVLST